MKKRFYCVMSEHYESGAVKAFITSRDSKVIPCDTERNIPGMTAENIWFDSMEAAERKLSEVTQAA
jgi:hypothetical protein